MRIRTQFIINTAVFGAILLIIAASLIITNQRIQESSRQEEVVGALEQGANELSYLSSAYLLYHESQQLSRWESKLASFSDDLLSLNANTAEQRQLVNDIKVNQDRLKAVLAEAKATIEGAALARGSAPDQEFTRVAWSRMEVQNQGIIFDSSRLSQTIHGATDRLKEIKTWLMFVLIGVFGAFLFANYILTHRRILQSISALQAGTRVIGSGNLDFLLEEKRRDEIGELSRAFNRMTGDLKAVTASKADLEREIAERQRVEDRASRQNTVLEGINRIFREAIVSETEEHLGKICLEVAQEVTKSKFGFLGEIGSDDLLHDIAMSDPGWELCTMYDKTGHRRPPGNFTVHGIYGRVLADGKPLFTNDPPSHPDSVGTPEGHPRVEAFLGVPLIRDGKTIGMVGLGNKEGGYRSEDLEALEALGSVIVQAFMHRRAEDDRERLLIEAQRRAAELDVANKELEAFSYSVSHDLRAPLRHIDGFSLALLEDCDLMLNEQSKNYLSLVRAASQRMAQLIDDMLMLSRVTRREMTRSRIDLSALAENTAAEIKRAEPERSVDFVITPQLVVEGDSHLLRVALENLLGNAWKFTSTRESATIEFGVKRGAGPAVYFVRDNGVGFDMAYAGKLFGAFQRLHSESEFPGTGIGLATVQRIIHRHGGRVWAESVPDRGATFYFTL